MRFPIAGVCIATAQKASNDAHYLCLTISLSNRGLTSVGHCQARNLPSHAPIRRRTRRGLAAELPKMLEAPFERLKHHIQPRRMYSPWRISLSHAPAHELVCHHRSARNDRQCCEQAHGPPRISLILRNGGTPTLR